MIVTFTESHVEQAWTKDGGSLLEFVENHGFTPANGCRSGTCKVNLLKGNVSYTHAISTTVNKDEILLCCAVPPAEPENGVDRLEVQC